ncbi:hypothetical protein PU629_05500 [Pullulanibacillus sp. KACC 23026]|uniref:hypothetical protein n=1 Tax=Pullulanibacillus sp. KACC 23026 TaxID=3028315 RepID=UPI0023B059E4|nr:hypothetical protein [Pullulanibacillus sp. KACC 23026]WEG13822.1 hypothetical protein PU629_05500 [Pullulanibacillus sp. KACC 23026]
MFDPTVYDNLKVVLEGSVYDLDLSGDIEISDRSDIIDLAKMARAYSVGFKKTQSPIEGLLILATDADSWAGEVLEDGYGPYPCELMIQFFIQIKEVDHDCSGIRFRLNQIWRDLKPKIEQQLSFIYGQDQTITNQITLTLPEPVDELFIMDIPIVLNKMIETLNSLARFSDSK